MRGVKDNLFRCGRPDVLMGYERVCRHGEMDPFVASIRCRWSSLTDKGACETKLHSLHNHHHESELGTNLPLAPQNY